VRVFAHLAQVAARLWVAKTTLSAWLPSDAARVRFPGARLRAALGWRFRAVMAGLGVAAAGSRGKMKLPGAISHPPQPSSISRPTAVSLRSFSSPSSIHFFLVRDRWRQLTAPWWWCSLVAGGELLRRSGCLFVCCCRESEEAVFFLYVAFFFLSVGSATSSSSTVGSATSTSSSPSSVVKRPRG
jgi:hypothetical protein